MMTLCSQSSSGWALACDELEPRRMWNRAFAHHVPRVERARGLEHQNLGFLFRHGPMLHAARYDEHVARREINRSIAKLHAEGAAMDEKELVLVLVMMPVEGALDLRDLHVLPIELADDSRTPVIVDRGELSREHHLLHRHPSKAITHSGAPSISA